MNKERTEPQSMPVWLYGPLGQIVDGLIEQGMDEDEIQGVIEDVLEVILDALETEEDSDPDEDADSGENNEDVPSRN